MLRTIAAPVRTIKRHKKKIITTILVVTSTGTWLMFRNQREFNEFLKERGLTTEYYTPENSY